MHAGSDAVRIQPEDEASPSLLPNSTAVPNQLGVVTT
jgi:hypothetical protein